MPNELNDLDALVKEFDVTEEQYQLEQRVWRLNAAELCGPLHKGRACRTPFNSLQKRDAMCQSSRRIISHWEERLTSEAEKCATFDEAKTLVMNDLHCDQSAHQRWSGIKGVASTKTELIAKLLKWVELAHSHVFRHVFFNRFRTRA